MMNRRDPMLTVVEIPTRKTAKPPCKVADSDGLFRLVQKAWLLAVRLEPPLGVPLLRCRGSGGPLHALDAAHSRSPVNVSGVWHPDAVKRSVAHQVRAAYHRGAHWAGRVRMMQSWSDVPRPTSRRSTNSYPGIPFALQRSGIMLCADATIHRHIMRHGRSSGMTATVGSNSAKVRLWRALCLTVRSAAICLGFDAYPIP